MELTFKFISHINLTIAYYIKTRSHVELEYRFFFQIYSVSPYKIVPIIVLFTLGSL